MEINDSSGVEAANGFVIHKSATACDLYAKSMSSFDLQSLLPKILKTEKLDQWLLHSNYSNSEHVFYNNLCIVKKNKARSVIRTARQ